MTHKILLKSFLTLALIVTFSYASEVTSNFYPPITQGGGGSSGSEVSGTIGNGTISGNVGGGSEVTGNLSSSVTQGGGGNSGSEVSGTINNGTISGNVGGGSGSEVSGTIGNGTIAGNVGGGSSGSEVSGTIGNGTMSGNVSGSSTSSGSGGGGGSSGGGGGNRQNITGQVLGASTTGESSNPGQVLGVTYSPGFPTTGLGSEVTPSVINLIGLILSFAALMTYAYYRIRLNA